jgi:peptidyl-prolyl cis-trans isomerase C
MSARKWLIRGLAGAALVAGTAGRAPAQPAAAPAATATAAKPVAVVNGEPITATDLEQALKLVGPSAVPLTEQQKQATRELALDDLIEDALMHQFLRQYAPKATDAQVNQELADMAEALKAQKKTLAELFKESGMPEAQWRVVIGYRVQWRAYCQAQVTDAVLKQYYDANKEFFDKVRVRASHIVIRVHAGTPPAEVEAARAKLTALRQQLLQNKIDFAEAAKQYSQCPTATKGGDLDYFPRKGVIDENFARTAFAMKPGEVSDIVQTDYGLHLIKVTDRTPPQPSEFEKIKEDVRMFCIAEMQQNILTHMHKNAKIEKSL